jgi:hypothetical protein
VHQLLGLKSGGWILWQNETSEEAKRKTQTQPCALIRAMVHPRTSSESIGKLGKVLSALAIVDDGMFSSTHRKSSSLKRKGAAVSMTARFDWPSYEIVNSLPHRHPHLAVTPAGHAPTESASSWYLAGSLEQSAGGRSGAV